MLQVTIPDAVDQAVDNPDGWYGIDFNVTEWQQAHRIPGTAPTVLAQQLALAIERVNGKLAAWKAEQVLAGITLLPWDKEASYREAVFSYATALLIPILPSFITGERAREDLELLRQKPGSYKKRADAEANKIQGKAPSAGRTVLI